MLGGTLQKPSLHAPQTASPVWPTHTNTDGAFYTCQDVILDLMVKS